MNTDLEVEVLWGVGRNDPSEPPGGVETPALGHRLGAWRLDPGHLERVEDRVRADLDEGVAQRFFLEIDRHPGPKTRS